MSDKENYAQTWVRILRAEKGLEESDERRRQLNAAITTIATKGSRGVFVPSVSVLLKGAAKRRLVAAKYVD